ncbi:MAG TPA: hypothetical protein PLE45_06915 [Spirochaetota bacterium]|nr:hypothetical protein [Spirochaetota bacterium]HOL56968.1 hypothetical protein [Spirochaetota bacterium]HPP04441.1 hypothetical protein [Spirochaetota bacterium]
MKKVLITRLFILIISIFICFGIMSAECSPEEPQESGSTISTSITSSTINQNFTWTERNVPGRSNISRWFSITSSSDGNKLAACADGMKNLIIGER